MSAAIVKPSHDLDGLEANLTSLKGALRELGDGSDLDEMIKLIREPLWTTPAEWALVFGLVGIVKATTVSIRDMRQVLLTGSRAVGAPAPNYDDRS